jgi:hypothetical protein
MLPKKVAILSIGAAALAVGALAYYILNVDPCETIVHQSVPGPDRKKMIVVFEAKCGATVGFNTQPSIASTFVYFSRLRNPAFFSMNGQHELTVEWKDGKNVAVSIPGGDKIYRKDAQSDDVSVEYRD